MVDSWPAGLPQSLLAEDIAGADPDDVLSTEMDAGVTKLRPRGGLASEPLSGSMLMTLAELNALRDFLKTTIAGRTLPFYFPDHYGEGTVLVRFVERPTWRMAGPDLWRVTLSLEILP